MIKTVNKTWGKEEWMVNNEIYCLKRITVNRSMWSSEGRYHYHKIKDETFIIEEGLLIVDCLMNHVPVLKIFKEGDTFRISPGMRHRFTSESKQCIFLEVSTHHDDSDSYREEYLDVRS